MTSGHNSSREKFERIVSDLPFDPSEETVNGCLKSISRMEDTIEYISTPRERGKSTGYWADDEYNSLLRVYTEPRSRSEDGLVSGLTFTAKDNIASKDLLMTCGLSDFKHIPSYDATVFERVLDEGGTILGKNNLEPFAIGPTGDHSDFGRVENPIAEKHIPGGSSSGSAAAVAAGITDVAFGTDTGGSIRIPAACCGVVGVKPTHRLVPRYGLVDYYPSSDVIGPISRDIETAAQVLETVAGYDPLDPSSVPSNLNGLTNNLEVNDDTVVALVEPFTKRASKPVRDSIYELYDTLGESGVIHLQKVSPRLEDIEIVQLFPYLTVEFSKLLEQSGVVYGNGPGYNEEYRSALQSYMEEHTFNDYFASRILPGAYLSKVSSGRAYTAVQERLAAFDSTLLDLFENIDVLLMPTLRILPPKYSEVNEAGEIEQAVDLAGNTAPFSLTGNPAVSLPINEVNGLPVSVQIVASKFDDESGLRVAKYIEENVDVDFVG